MPWLFMIALALIIIGVLFVFVGSAEGALFGVIGAFLMLSYIAGLEEDERIASIHNAAERQGITAVGISGRVVIATAQDNHCRVKASWTTTTDNDDKVSIILKSKGYDQLLTPGVIARVCVPPS